MTGKMTLALTLDKADIDILKILNSNCYLIMGIRFVADNMILLDVSGYDSIGCERIY